MTPLLLLASVAALAFLDPALVNTPAPPPEAVATAGVLIGVTGLTGFATIAAFLLRRIGTRAKAVTPAQLADLEKSNPRLAAAIVLAASIAWDLAAIAEALPALIHGRAMSGKDAVGGGSDGAGGAPDA